MISLKEILLEVIAYRGSMNSSDVLNIKRGSGRAVQSHSMGAYFTNSQKFASKFGNNLYKADINLDKCLDLRKFGEDGENVSEFINSIPVSINDSVKRGIIYNSKYLLPYKVLEDLDVADKIVIKLRKLGYECIAYKEQGNDVFVIINKNAIENYTKLEWAIK